MLEKVLSLLQQAPKSPTILHFKKRAFILPEVLAALLLILLCAVPLVRQPLQLFREETESLEKMEKMRLAEWSFSEIYEMFLRNKIPWKQVPGLKKWSPPITLPPLILNLPYGRLKSIEPKFALFCEKEKIGKNNATYRSLKIHIIFSPKETYEYKVLVKHSGDDIPHSITTQIQNPV